MATIRIDLGLAAPVRLGRLALNPALREIRRDDGAEEIIEPRVMQVLLALAEARSEIVRREDLTERCWEGRIVGEDAINRVLSRLRRVAEGIGEDSFRIETITKVGYRLVELDDRAGGVPGSSSSNSPPPPAGPLQGESPGASRHARHLATATVLFFMIGIGGWWFLRPTPAHSMMVRLAGFRPLSAGLPPTLREAVDAEITAAFNADGVIGVSTASAPPPGQAPAYALGGTIYRVGNSVRVITRFTNERTGAILWSDRIDYAADQASKVPHKIAVDAGIVIRCGLFGVSTHHKSLPDAVLANYLQYCQEYWAYGGSKTLRFAQLVVAAAPDFSWGWSAVGNGFMQVAQVEPDSRRAEKLRAAGRRAEDRALALDRANSEALGHKAFLIDPHDWIGQERLFKSAIAAKPLDCGCEHYGYGWKLVSMGRLDDAVQQFLAATDMLALWSDSQLALAGALIATGRAEEAKPHFAAAIDISKDANFDKWVAVTQGTETGDYAAAISALRSPEFQIPEEPRAGLLSGYQALASGNAQAKTKAIRTLIALPSDKQSETVATMLAALGANREALEVARERPWLFWRRSMRGVLSEPDFPTVANQLGLMTYWKTTRIKPDICSTKSPPPFCGMI
ncbi:winged helix-turn-helix domain-containing protein [Sphingopyxis panaciterrulae]|uniref:DNA-binding winged helix-turn-helix (WHTH) protein/tetratricopeptide (TPR) repeat protein n=1 Tax=Sphingopyxis panaciterrulae TaxID=462372 RepID=A0A7W9B7G8_9SPHN|nr:winged helix-turn-helix domain-containing protein [Sphingopyxis panaciterrulae]MBB5707651.1 DNA-binding winged helix-turn-helix (wHTH) protein/tetratricopeptide (TPR) repeat protein [Sphingopyxis panaciterrulae]